MFPTHDLAGFGIFIRDDKWVMRGDKVMGVWEDGEVRILNEDEPEELMKLGLDWETDEELENNIPAHPVFYYFRKEAAELYGWEDDGSQQPHVQMKPLVATPKWNATEVAAMIDSFSNDLPPPPEN